ncbi:hypothetical protein L226DRAFT_251332 [Lentinus tigrinus ALCF2SS1-7]|uniref:Uncharacterized protein n=1 Tax=Lentinus tigrinus ALCF2SS1-6 TaxID=1328759 RepID=A0A5C2RZZ8_9APHY|nr:hypothetical protein L227DRAFT_255900 [Lentinus tigrinus ALCF2SS1-6]RPD79498.1 hypothetical protein L226DRAFT_251332 [Lentinus tigrinus ALCF2SS1-7]
MPSTRRGACSHQSHPFTSTHKSRAMSRCPSSLPPCPSSPACKVARARRMEDSTLSWCRALFAFTAAALPVVARAVSAFHSSLPPYCPSWRHPNAPRRGRPSHLPPRQAHAHTRTPQHRHQGNTAATRALEGRLPISFLDGSARPRRGDAQRRLGTRTWALPLLRPARTVRDATTAPPPRCASSLPS